MEKLVPILNDLQGVLGVLGANEISLPQLVVVGAQSSGKSSVLENIVGRDFLPRGNNIVTRRPLVLQLINTNTPESDLLSSHNESSPTKPRRPRKPSVRKSELDESAPHELEWGEFEHVQKRFYDFAQIKAEITRETERLTGRGTSISSTPIRLRIYSPHVPTLNLVDLPGITKVATGDQPADIERQIRQMVLHFIMNPNSIIVAVSSATEDLANSEALKIAREVDPACARTIGVITKLDLMDEGTDASMVLYNRVIPLNLGYIGIVNRGQRAIQLNKSIEEALEHEHSFFREHPVYRSMATKVGTQSLTKRLSSLLLSHLCNFLPVIRQQIMTTIQETEKELDSYGNPLGIEGFGYSVLSSSGYDDDYLDSPLTLLKSRSTTNELSEEERKNQYKLRLGPMLLEILSKFASYYIEALEGRSATPLNDSSSHELFGGARISYVFHDIFSQAIDTIDPFDLLSDADIRTAIRNAAGPRPTLFLPEICFEILVKKQIERLKSPCISCVDMVLEELQRVALQCETLNFPQLSRFPVLRDELHQTVREMLRAHVGSAKRMVRNLVNIELAYINTNHPEFIGASSALTQLALQESRSPSYHLSQILSPPNIAGNGLETKPNGSSLIGAVNNISKWGFGWAVKGNANEKTVPNTFGVMIPESDVKQSTIDNSIPHGKNDQKNGMEEEMKTTGPPFLQENPYIPPEQMQNFSLKNPTERERIETEVIKLLINSYFMIVKKTVKDTVPKAIMAMLVNKSKLEVQSVLMGQLYKEDQFERLLKEADDVAAKRESCIQLITIMRRALVTINQIKDISLVTQEWK